MPLFWLGRTSGSSFLDKKMVPFENVEPSAVSAIFIFPPSIRTYCRREIGGFSLEKPEKRKFYLTGIPN